MKLMILSTQYEPGFPPDWEGLDYETARDAVPHWYSVSSGNGNDGVSRTYPDYYVRTREPFRLALLACVTTFKQGEGQSWAIKACEVEGEAEYSISATIYDPPEDDDTPDIDTLQEAYDNADEDDVEAVREAYRALEEAKANAESSWCDANGAWLIFEIARVEDEDIPPAGQLDKMQYASLDAAYSAADLALVTE